MSTPNFAIKNASRYFVFGTPVYYTQEDIDECELDKALLGKYNEDGTVFSWETAIDKLVGGSTLRMSFTPRTAILSSAPAGSSSVTTLLPPSWRCCFVLSINYYRHVPKSQHFKDFIKLWQK